MPGRDIVVIGASTGGIEALKALASGLPRDFRASVFVVLHIAPHGLGILPEILTRAGPLPASNARDWERIEPGHIYVAPPDYHLLVERGGYTRVTRGPKENRSRPAVDPLFRSAAYAFGPRVVGVVLTGWLDDGTAGLRAVKERGGTTVVQHPEDALAPSMPLNALKHVEVDHCVPLSEVAPLLARLVGEPAAEEGEYPVPERMETEVRIAHEKWMKSFETLTTDEFLRRFGEAVAQERRAFEKQREAVELRMTAFDLLAKRWAELRERRGR